MWGLCAMLLSVRPLVRPGPLPLSHRERGQARDVSLSARGREGRLWGGGCDPGSARQLHETRRSSLVPSPTSPVFPIANGDNSLSKIIPVIMASDAYKNNGVISSITLGAGQTLSGEDCSLLRPDSKK